MLQFGQRLYSWFCAAILVLGTVILCAYSLTPNARSLHLPWAFYPLLGAVSGVVALGSAFLQLLTQHQIDLMVFGQGHFTAHGCASSIGSIVLSMGHLVTD